MHFDEVIVTPQVLPDNYLPVALAALQGEAGFNHVFIPSDTSEALALVSDASLRDPSALCTTFAGEGALGPRSNLPRFHAPNRSGAPQQGSGKRELVLAVIDTGIAFWNPAFRTDPSKPRSCLFHAMGYMTLNGNGAQNSAPCYEVLELDRAEILEMNKPTPTASDHQELVRRLGDRFPESVYANGLQADRFSHGTAMADLLVQPSLANGKSPKMVGLELPVSALADTSGAILRALLPRALAAVDDLARGVVNAGAQPDVICVLSYGATGPLLDESVAGGAFAGKLFIPTGNHLQDRLYAVLAADDKITWMLPPDDASPNTIEIKSDAQQPQLRLTDPRGANVPVPVEENGLSLLKHGNDVIGAVLAAKTGDAWQITLTLSGTRSYKGLPTALAGRWQLHNDAGGPLRLWVQRDEQTSVQTKVPRLRQSYFEDADYVKRDALGRFPINDAQPPESSIRRNGSVSAFAGLGASDAVVTVGALERIGGQQRTAYYSGIFESPGDQPSQTHLVDEDRYGRGTLCLGNGTSRKYRVSGTSAAAAIGAGQAALAWQAPADTLT